MTKYRRIEPLVNAANRDPLTNKMIAFGKIRGTLTYDKRTCFIEYKHTVYEVKSGVVLATWNVEAFDTILEVKSMSIFVA